MKISIENPESKQYEEKQLTSPLDELNKIMNFHHPLDYMLNEVDGDAIHYHYETIGEIFPREFDYIETALKDYEKKTKLAKEYADVNNVAKRLKALEIIKEKNVDVGYFKECKSLGEYNNECGMTCWNELTQEEYDLLKEVLK